MSPLVLRMEPAVFVSFFVCPEAGQIPSVQTAAGFAQTNSPFELATMAGRGSAASDPEAAVGLVTEAASGQQAMHVASCSASDAEGFVH
jgi:hypothetical protein